MIRDLTIEVTQKGNASATDFTGALLSHAQNAAISGVTAEIVSENGSYTAGIAGTLDAASVIDGCSVVFQGTAAGTTCGNFGGIAGYCYGTIRNCTFTLGAGSYAAGNFGGIAYGVLGGAVENCSAYVKNVSGLSGAFYAGGVAGYIEGSTIRNCAAAVSFDASAAPISALGGIVGQINTGDVIGCTVTGAVSGRTYVGGIAGLTLSSVVSDQTISGCTVDAAVSGFNNVGGIIGDARATGSFTFSDCTAAGTVTGSSAVGGLAGSVRYIRAGTAERPNLFLMENCVSYVSRVTSEQIGGRAAAASGGTPDVAAAGGAIGMVSGDFENCSTTIRNCASYSDVTASSSCAGGFVGYHTARERAKSGGDYVYYACSAYGSAAVSDGCGVPGYMDVQNAAVGGFFGCFTEQTQNMRIGYCSAYGNASVASDDVYGMNHAGGFLGYCYGTSGDIAATLLENCTAVGRAYGAWGVGGFAGRLDCVTVKNCEASGDVKLRLGGSGGGFAGGLFGASVGGCTARGSVMELDPAQIELAAGSAIGGFAGDVGVLGDTTVDRCTAYGAAYGRNCVGGFLGQLRSATASNLLSFTKCTSYGGAYDYSVYDPATNFYENGKANNWGFGGFVGAIPEVTGNVSFSGCTAYGKAVGKSVGGFLGYGNVHGNQSYIGCTVYGDAYECDVNGQAGGFLGWMRGLSETSSATINNCHIYGNAYVVSGYAEVSALGAIAVATRATSVVSHNTTFRGNTGRSAEFVVVCMGAQGSDFKNCYYENATHPGDWEFYNLIDGVTEEQVSFTNCGQGTFADANFAAEPKATVTIANASGNVALRFTGFTNIPAGTWISGITISTDGGKTFTELMYDDKTLVRMTSGGALVECGAKISVDQNLDLTYTYELPQTVSAYPAGSIRVMLVLTNGFTVVATG